MDDRSASPIDGYAWQYGTENVREYLVLWTAPEDGRWAIGHITWDSKMGWSDSCELSPREHVHVLKKALKHRKRVAVQIQEVVGQPGEREFWGMSVVSEPGPAWDAAATRLSVLAGSAPLYESLEIEGYGWRLDFEADGQTLDRLLVLYHCPHTEDWILGSATLAGHDAWGDAHEFCPAKHRDFAAAALERGHCIPVRLTERAGRSGKRGFRISSSTLAPPPPPGMEWGEAATRLTALAGDCR